MSDDNCFTFSTVGILHFGSRCRIQTSSSHKMEGQTQIWREEGEDRGRPHDISRLRPDDMRAEDETRRTGQMKDVRPTFVRADSGANANHPASPRAVSGVSAPTGSRHTTTTDISVASLVTVAFFCLLFRRKPKKRRIFCGELKIFKHNTRF